MTSRTSATRAVIPGTPRNARGPLGSSAIRAMMNIALGNGTTTLDKRVSAMPGQTQQTAYEIGYDLLNKTKRAYFEDDFQLFASAFMLPHEHVTLQGTAVLETEEDLRVLFERMKTQFRDMQIDDIVRQLVSAEFVTPFNILATAVSYYYSRGQRLNDPFPVCSTLLRCGHEWRIATANYAIPLNGIGLASAIMPSAFPSEIENQGRPPGQL